MVNQKRIRCAIMRGGTSKGVFFQDRDLPDRADRRNAAILALMGSPDPRQIDGLGGAHPLTSKIAIIGGGLVRIGHPTGVFPVRIARDARGNLTEASYSRTARRLMVGVAYLPGSALA